MVRNLDKRFSRGATAFISLLVTILLSLAACADPVHESTGLSRILEEFSDAQGSKVLVVAHRGDWKRAPENSLSAIHSSISLGVDIVEVDVAMTSDGQLVLMHDPTVDRTTNGHGAVAEMTLADLRQLRLRMHDGSVTEERVPMLREALRAAKGRCMLDLDRAFVHSAEVHRLLVEEGMLGQAILKSPEPPSAAEARISGLSPKPTYMPLLIDLPETGLSFGSVEEASEQIRRFADLIDLKAFEVAFASDTSALASQEAIELMKLSGARIWVNTLRSGRLSGGLSDEMAMESADAVWGRLIDWGVNIIQTDEAEMLLAYLRGRGLHW